MRQPRLEYQQVYVALAQQCDNTNNLELHLSDAAFLKLSFSYAGYPCNLSLSYTRLLIPPSDTNAFPSASTLLQFCDLQQELAGGLGTVVSSTFIGFLILLLQCGLQ